MTRRPFHPTARQTNVLLTVGFLALGYALYLRYLVIEQSTVGIPCEAGLATWLCLTRAVTIALFTYSVFGVIALAAAVVHVIRPSLPRFLIGLLAAAFGIVLYNVAASSLAVALLILSFARSQPAKAQ
jgi:hypothetical protein